MFTNATVQFTDTVTAQGCVNYPVLSDLCADEIGQRIIRAYVQLVFQPVDTDQSRSIIVMRLGLLEIRVTELHLANTRAGLPPFWVEVLDGLRHANIDSVGCYDFDEDELAAAVEMIVSAAYESGTINVSPPY